MLLPVPGMSNLGGLVQGGERAGYGHVVNLVDHIEIIRTNRFKFSIMALRWAMHRIVIVLPARLGLKARKHRIIIIVQLWKLFCTACTGD